MGKATAIEWTDHTFNPWTGCTKVSAACDHCYAEALAKRSPRTFGSWEPGAERKRTSAAYWRQPLRWNREAYDDGERRRVFCASMADVFDNQAPDEWRRDLWQLIYDTPSLDWLLLTKRPQNIARMLPEDRLQLLLPWPWDNVWLGTTVENQAEADRRIPHLLAVPAKVRFLSCEPLLGPVDLVRACQFPGRDYGEQPLDWVIAGGESGPGARPSHPDWFRSLRDQCVGAGVPFFFKQWGDWGWPSEGGGAPQPRDVVLHTDGSTETVRQNDARWRHMDRNDPSWRFRESMQHENDVVVVRKIGKKAAGAQLDGREHREVPHA